MPRIAILGGGLCGRLTALQLAEQGLSVALFDKGGRKSEHAAAYVAAAMLAPAAEAVEATPEVIKLGRQSIPLWRNIKGRLKTPTMMQENGSLIVWHGQDKPLSSEFVRHLKRGGVADDEIVRGARRHRRTRTATRRTFFRRHLPADRRPARRTTDVVCTCRRFGQAECPLPLGTRMRPRRPASPIRLADRLPRLRRKTVWNQAPEHTSTLRGIRGEVARVYTPEITLNRPVRLLHPRYPLYIAPKETTFSLSARPKSKAKAKPPPACVPGWNSCPRSMQSTPPSAKPTSSKSPPACAQRSTTTTPKSVTAAPHAD